MNFYFLINCSTSLYNRPFNINDEMFELRERARKEIRARNNEVVPDDVRIEMYNYFGPRCEVKLEAINIRDKKLLPALREGRSVILDFILSMHDLLFVNFLSILYS